jgi:hypothetical protein
MPRRLKIATAEMGYLELFLIYSVEGRWESDWEPLQGQPICDLLTHVSKEMWDHALRGWTSPLVKNLGLPPEGGLRKMSQVCTHLDSCPMHDLKRCTPLSKRMFNCFQPLGVEGDIALQLAAEIVRFWREGVRVLVVEE